MVRLEGGMCIENGFADNQRERGEDDRLENPEEDAGCEETGKVFRRGCSIRFDESPQSYGLTCTYRTMHLDIMLNMTQYFTCNSLFSESM